MPTHFAALLVTLAFVIPAMPQTIGASSSLENSRRILEWQQKQTDPQTQEATRRKAAEFEAHQFQMRLAEFASVWNDFVREYNADGTYNVKKARSLSRALKKLQSQLPRE